MAKLSKAQQAIHDLRVESGFKEPCHYAPDYTGGPTAGICGKDGGISMHLDMATCPDCIAEANYRKRRAAKAARMEVKS